MTSHKKSPVDSGLSTATFVEHLAELRKRLIIIAVVNLAAALICYQYSKPLIEVLMALNPGMRMVYLTPSELFMVYVKLAVLCAVVFCFPVTASQIWSFISKGLMPREKIFGLLSLIFGVFFFLLGAVFCYYTALPVTLNFFMRLTLEGVNPMISIESYISFTTVMLAGFGAAFEMPVVVFLLSELNILKPAFLKRAQGILILIIFIIAAVITPPDVVSQIMLAIPMVILLEFSMGICWIIDRRKKRREAASSLL